MRASATALQGFKKKKKDWKMCTRPIYLTMLLKAKASLYMEYPYTAGRMHIYIVCRQDILLGFYSIIDYHILTDYKVFYQFYNFYKDDEIALNEEENMDSFTQLFAF